MSIDEQVKKEEKKLLGQTKVIKIKNDTFTFDIAKVSVTDYLTIENEKIRLTAGNYSKLAMSVTTNAFTAANIIDMIAIFRVLMPKIEDCVPTKDFTKLSVFDLREMLIIYIKEFSPWYNAWMKEFNSPFMPEEDNKGEKDGE